MNVVAEYLFWVEAANKTMNVCVCPCLINDDCTESKVNANHITPRVT